MDHRRRVKLRRLLAGERVCDETTIVAMEPAVPDAEAFARALAAERRRSIRFVAWLRFLGISIAFALKALGVPVLVSEETRRRAGDAIGFAPAGAAQLRGRSQPVQAYRPLQAGGLDPLDSQVPTRRDGPGDPR